MPVTIVYGRSAERVIRILDEGLTEQIDASAGSQRAASRHGSPEGPDMVHTPRAPLTWLDHIRLTRIDVELEPEAPWTLPPEPETLLRGVLGSAIFDGLCARPHRRCGACDLRDRCEIPGWYEPGRLGGDRPRPLLPRSLDGPGERLGPGRPWRTSWIALGQIPRTAALIEALVRLGRLGLGQARTPHRLLSLSVRGEGPASTIVREDRETGAPWPAPGPLRALVELPQEGRGVRIRVVRPTRWKGADPDRDPTLGDLLGATLSRVRQVARDQGQTLDTWWDEPGALTQRWTNARWARGDRWNSHGEWQDLSGWMGTIRCGPEIGPWADLLAAGEVLGVGQHVSFGRGQIELDWI